GAAEAAASAAVEAGAAAGDGSAAAAAASVAGAAAAGSATRARPRRSSVGAFSSLTPAMVFGLVFFLGLFADPVVGLGILCAEVSTFLHACEGDAVTKLTNEKVPYFNAPIYLQNKTQIGKVDEIFGPINESYFSVKMMEGIIATSYKEGDKFYIDPMKLLPLSRFLPQPKYESM
ncbi:putative H/ACA ribonucleoprotein complex subunit 1-like protein 1, partial [Dichanthelium oligosanthes]